MCIRDRLNASWVVAHVERLGHEEIDPVRVKSVDDAFRLAERLGADIIRLNGIDRVAETLRFARRENITQIVIGRSGKTFWKRLARSSFTDQLVRQATCLLYTSRCV